MVWLVGTPPPNTNDPNEYAGDDTKTIENGMDYNIRNNNVNSSICNLFNIF